MSRKGTTCIHPHCYNMEEVSEAKVAREIFWSTSESETDLSPLEYHFSQNLAWTTGSALGSTPPSNDACLGAFQTPNSVGLTAGAKAWAKHAHRSCNEENGQKGWWGSPRGPMAKINEEGLAMFHKVIEGATWRNLHWLPHKVLVYEIRLPAGYGMRWSQDQSGTGGSSNLNNIIAESQTPDNERRLFIEQPWLFRGFVEPMMENGHEVGWRH